MIDLLFFVRGTERYRFDAGDTAQDGSLIVTYDDLERIRRENQKFALMDYNTALQDCDDSVVVRAASASGLLDRLKALDEWYPDRAEPLRKRIARSPNKTLASTESRAILREAREHSVELVCEKR